MKTKEEEAAYQREWNKKNREARKLSKRAYYLAHKDRLKKTRYGESGEKAESVSAYQKEWYGKNAEAQRAKKRNHYQQNREKELERHRKYRAENLEVVRERRRAFYQNNKKKIIKRGYERTKERYKNDLKFKLRCSLRTRLGTALKRKGIRKHKKTLKLLGCTLDQLKEHLEKRFTEGMTWENHGEWHIDHIRPLCTFDLTVPEELEKAAHFSNLQPLWAIDNLRKGPRLTS